MNDEGIGIAGWLLADLVLVLAIVFLAFTPAAGSDEPDEAELPVTAEATPTAKATVEAPLIRDLGCVRTDAEARTDVRCEPELAGGEPSSYAWEAERGSARSYGRGLTFAASFAEAGAVRLTVANEGGEARTEFAVLPQPTPTPTPESANLVLESFRFDQIVFCGAVLGEVDWGQIAAGRVRENVSKDLEVSGTWCEGEDGGAMTFLEAKQQEGFRIAMVETFSNLNNSTSTKLSNDVNDRFTAGLRKAATQWLPPGSHDGDLFVDCGPDERWFASYFDRGLDPGEVRINIFFVRRNSDIVCP
ncbi:MAG: hypothetical protein OXG35_19135 [Acidobacteria bacterium]|nr:hypothetical protein [Acidobacteriota bacterium]